MKKFVKSKGYVGTNVSFVRSSKVTLQGYALQGYNEAFGVMNGYQSTIGNHVALRFDEFFHGIFKPPRKTNEI